MDILTVIVLSICVLVPFAAAMIAIAFVVYPPRFASAIKDLKDLQADLQSDKSGRELEVKPTLGVTVLLLMSIIGLCLVTCLIALVLALAPNIPWHLLR